ncbi:putative mitochondrial import inner membrane translocase subunit TIM23 [Pseudovirgaria hyperparasitica]|uniref:Putative mitochondrial import inner membrane translocase subunit TIM23 n=1 Tax=Pseudovirgaria hyperparasitica TaxID=470096 RepID=A0A6A6WLV8_9PEZI|nr:putative mitochondrial import inner membrane translocase subunit TIM23 [Pseudovirgaria hyperparasitica]KAF2763181.1 putative mitochondrial import inner membrane translocase subunit TIM23 [Pseudovirgaria hyperparasitica]
MTIWDTLTGRKSTSPTTQTTPTSTFDDNASSSSASPFTSDTISAPTTSFMFDAASLHPLANVNQDTLDYLTLEDSVLSDLPGSRSALPSRGWSDDLCYGTGVTYLSALTVGGAWGLAEGWNRSPVTATPRLRMNYVLNAVTRRGPFLGNSAGVIAMVYNGINSTIGYARGRHDAANSIVAGGLSGMVFKSTRGLKPMLISGGIVASIAGAWALTRKTFFDNEE